MTDRKKGAAYSGVPHLLLLESDEQEASNFQRAFGDVARHWHIAWEKDGAAAVRRIINQGFPDLLVTRLDLPLRSGIDVIEWARSIQSPKALPVLVYDTELTEEQRKQLSSWQVADYLDKKSPPEKSKLILQRITFNIEKGMIVREVVG